MMQKVYVIQEVGYEYNDEYYYRTESNGGIPVKAFTSKDKAQEKIIELIEEQLKSKYFSPFMFKFSDEDTEHEDLERLTNKIASISHVLPTLSDWDDVANWSADGINLTDDERHKLAELIFEECELYEIVELDID